MIQDIAGFIVDNNVVITTFGVIFMAVIITVKLMHKAPTQQVATIATSIGIFFTFLGISAGLIYFDFQQDPDNAIPRLIDSLQIAFITSLFGVGFATLIKLIDGHWFLKRDKSAGKTTNELLSLLGDKIDNLNNSIGGNEEGSLLTQIKTLRTENNDNNKKIVEAVNTFAEKVAKNQTEELITALEKVLKNLEQTIQDKLGESFKQFSESVKELVVWQAEYKEIIVKTTNELNTVLEVFSETNKTLESIKNNNQQTQETNTRIKEMLELQHEQLKKVEETLRSIASVPDTFKEITRNIDNVNEQYKEMSSHIQTNNDHTLKSFERLEQGIKGSLDSINDELKKTLSSIQEVLPELDRGFADMTTRLRDTLIDYIERMNNAIRDMNNRNDR